MATYTKIVDEQLSPSAQQLLKQAKTKTKILKDAMEFYTVIIQMLKAQGIESTYENILKIIEGKVIQNLSFNSQPITQINTDSKSDSQITDNHTDKIDNFNTDAESKELNIFDTNNNSEVIQGLRNFAQGLMVSSEDLKK